MQLSKIFEHFAYDGKKERSVYQLKDKLLLYSLRLMIALFAQSFCGSIESVINVNRHLQLSVDCGVSPSFKAQIHNQKNGH